MSTSASREVSTTPGAEGARLFVLRRLPRRTFLVAAILLIAAGMFLKWDVLVAAGIAPVILGLLPCAAMCALGACAGRMGGKGECGKDASAPGTTSSKMDAA